MQQRTTKVNPSEETIKIGPLGIRFLLTGDDSNGSVSVFEVLVPLGQKLAAPAHKNDAYEEVLYGIEGVLTWTVDGTSIEVGPGQAALHSQRRDAPLRQSRQQGCETARGHIPCDHESCILPPGRRSNLRYRRRFARSRENDGCLPPSRA
jgi:hypothetical protein